ncbi:unnamed protein product, partial [Vitis vinifera]
MLKKGLKPRRLFFTPKKNLATCSPALDPPPSSAPTTEHHNKLCFTLTDRLIRRGVLSLGQQVVRRMIKQSPSVSDAILAVDKRLIDGLCDKGHVDEAFYMFDTMRERTGLPATIHLYKTLFYGLCRQERVEEAELFVGEMESEGHFIDKMMYTSLIHGYCRGKKMRTAMRVFLRMLKMGCDPDTYTYNTLIHGFVKLGLFDKGWILHNQMSEWGLQPNVVTYHIMIRRYCEEGKVDCALTLLSSMSSFNLTPSVHSYTVLITALYKENRLVEVEELYKKMLDIGVVPDHVLFFTLMQKQPKGHELHLALKILQAIAKNGCNLDLCLLSTSATHSPTQDVEQEIECLLGEIVRRNFALADVAFGIFISALCAAGKTDAALLFMDKMVSLGCRPLLSTYNSLIKCLFQERLVEDAKSLIDLMQENGIVPDLATYLIMVHEHCNHGDLASAFGLLDQMNERGLKPSVAIYDSIIGCLSRRKRILEAENVFKMMLEAGVDPDAIIYVTMISGYSKNRRAIEARQLFDKMIEHGFQPSSHSYTAVISGLVKENMIDKGCSYLSDMLKDGFVPNTVLYTSLINQFLRKGELEFAFRLVDLMDRNQIECDMITCIALVSGVSRNITPVRRRWYHVKSGSARVREILLHLLHQSFVIPRENNLSFPRGSPRKIKYFALNLMQKIKGSSFMPNLYLYNGIISGFCRANMIQDAYNHFELMQTEGVCPNQVTFTILINGHTRFGEIDHAIGLFNKMNADGLAPDGITYNALIKGLCKAGRLLDALSVSHTMHKRGLFPNKSSYEKLLKCLCASHLGKYLGVKLDTNLPYILQHLWSLVIWGFSFGGNGACVPIFGGLPKSYSKSSWAIFILSANGAILNVNLHQPNSSVGTLTNEGHFEIFPWSGSCMPTESRGQRGDLAGMSISLAGPDGRVLGGGLGGLLGLMALFRFWWEVFCQATSRSKSQTSRELSLYKLLSQLL